MSFDKHEKQPDVQPQADNSLANQAGDLLARKPENVAAVTDAGREKLAMNPEAAKVNESVGLKVANDLESLDRHEPGKPSGRELLTKGLVEDWKQTFAYLDPKIFDRMSTTA